MSEHCTIEQLEAALLNIVASPEDAGPIEWIVRRPDVDEREVLEEAQLSVGQGLLGDHWIVRPSSSTADGSPHPAKQITIMNSRMIATLIGEKERWGIAGDQIYADLDLSLENLPPGTRLSIGEAELEVSEEPHTGCEKFISRFGMPAMKFVSSPRGRSLRLRGLNASVTRAGRVRVGDRITKG